MRVHFVLAALFLTVTVASGASALARCEGYDATTACFSTHQGRNFTTLRAEGFTPFGHSADSVGFEAELARAHADGTPTLAARGGLALYVLYEPVDLGAYGSTTGTACVSENLGAGTGCLP